jgi:hypothetical protein
MTVQPPPTPKDHDELSELVAVYALDALEPAEAGLVEEHLAVCPRCRAELAEHREVAALLAHTGAPAPEGVWSRIAAELDEGPAVGDGGPAGLRLGDVLPLARRERPARSGRRFGRAAAALGAAAAVVIAALGVQVVRQDGQLDDLRAEVEDGALDLAADVALRDPASQLVELTSTDGGLRVRAVIDPGGRGYVLAHNLPRLDDDETYQLWGLGPAPPISLGVLGADPAPAVFQVVGGLDGLAITAEAAPGVVASEKDAVVAGETA